MAIYQGADTMTASRAQSLWDVLQGQKRHTKEQDKQRGNKLIASGIGDILKTVFPGYGHIADIGIDMLSEKFLPMPEYEEDPSFWGSSQIEKYGEQADLINKAADPTLLGSIIENVGGYVGEESFDSLDLSSLFGDDVASNEQTFADWYAKNPTGTVSEFLGQPMKEGGRVPKYENGGKIVSAGDKRSLDKDLQAMQIMNRLKSVLEHDVEERDGKLIKDETFSSMYSQSPLSDYGVYQTIFEDLIKGKVSQTEGETLFGAPLQEEVVAQAPKKYYGGGMVQGAAPSIVDYFSMQGKTLGGSNTESISEILGKR